MSEEEQKRFDEVIKSCAYVSDWIRIPKMIWQAGVEYGAEMALEGIRLAGASELDDEWGDPGACPDCGKKWQHVRPGKSQPDCSCYDVE